MKKENKKMLAFLAAAVIISSGIASALFFGLREVEKEAKEEMPLSVKIFTDKTSGYPPFEVNFSYLVTGGNEELNFLWDFGDGETSTNKEPTHLYKGNKSYFCKLKVTSKNGKQTEDSIKISSKHNQAPRASIMISSTTPKRTFEFTPAYMMLRSATKSMGGRNLYYMRKLGIAPKSNEKSNINVSALVSDPEGDEIVSYTWELKPPTITLFGMKPHNPTYNYTGKNVTFDLLDTYVGGKYDLELTVVDEAGNIDSEIINFKVEESPIESSTFGMLKYYKDTWLKQLSGIDPIFAAVTGIIAFLLYKNKISKEISFPLLKLIFMVVLSTLKIQPEDYGDETIPDVGKEFFNKWEFLQVPTKNLFDKIEGFLRNRGKNDTADQLQVLEELLGLDNMRPQISDPYPENDAIRVSRDCPYVSIYVSDQEGENFSVTISGEYVNNVTYNDVTNNTFNATLNYPTPQGLPSRKDINWYVKVVDNNNKIVEGNYKFTTEA